MAFGKRQPDAWLVATQVVEAGVDIDFPKSSLPVPWGHWKTIVQCPAGRHVNREGCLGRTLGIVLVVFRPTARLEAEDGFSVDHQRSYGHCKTRLLDQLSSDDLVR